MSDSDKPDSKRPTSAPRPAAGRSGSARSIGEELGGLDFEPDALLDSLFEEEVEKEPLGATPVDLGDAETEEEPGSLAGPKLHEPARRDFPEDEVTFTGQVDGLGAKTPAAAPRAKPPIPTRGAPRPNAPAAAQSPGVPSAPRPSAPLRSAPRPGVPGVEPAAPSSRAASGPGARALPGVSSRPDPVSIVSSPPKSSTPTSKPALPGTAKPPAVNPAGPPPQEPFAMSPGAPAIGTKPGLGDTPRPKRADPLGTTVPAADPLGKTIQGADPLGKTAAAAPSSRSRDADPLASTVTAPPSAERADPLGQTVAGEPPPSAMDEDVLGKTTPAAPDAGPPPVIREADGSKPAKSIADSIADADLDALVEGTPSEVDPLEFEGDDPAPATPRAEPEPPPGPEPAKQEQVETALGAAAEVEAARSALMQPAPENAGQTWEDERDAVAHLSESESTDEWTARAQWLEAEAESIQDPAAKSRALLVASELLAMADDATASLRLAKAAAQSSGNMAAAHRQIRALATREGDWKTVASAVEAETRAARTPESRAHATYVAAEVQRLHVHDAAAAQRKLDKIARLLPNDPRPGVAKLATQLAETSAPKLRWPDAPELAPLAAATADIIRLRGDAVALDAPTPGPVAAFDIARRALARGKRAEAGEALAKLGEIDGIGTAAKWLSAALLATGAATRPRSIELLGQILEAGGGAAARRALATRALEQGDAEAIEAAISEADEEDATFSPADRVALGALTGGGEAAVQAIAAIATDENLRPLAAAGASSALGAETVPMVIAGAAAPKSEIALGRALSSSDPMGAVSAALDEFSSHHQGHPLARGLGLERSLAARAAGEVAAALSTWSSDGDARDAKLAAAIVHEAAKSAEAARTEYTAALSAGAVGEAPARALLPDFEPTRAADVLASVARGSSDPAQRALLLVEAAHRRAGEDADAIASLLEEAAEAEPTIPFAHGLGELGARSKGDAEALLTWLRRRREAASDPIEKALDLVREALLTADDDLPGAATALAEAAEARPTDIALHELHERLAPDASGGQWREAAAETMEGPGKARLYVEAALEFDRTGDAEGAARAATAAAASEDSLFAKAIAERTAAHSPGAARLAERLLAEAKEEQDVAAQRELYERLSELDQIRGDGASARLWHSAILERSPDHLPSLRHLENEFLGAGRSDDFEPIAAKLAELLDENEAEAHAVLACGLRVKNGAWTDARDLVERSAKRENPSLWALRQASAHARAAADDTAELDAERRLAERTERNYDRATLTLRAAEAATRLGKLDDAQALLDNAVEFAPNHLVALTTRAEVLEAREQFNEGAEAFEAVATASGVDVHRVQAWHQAAVLWLDHTEERDRGVTALEQSAALDITHADVFERLRAIYVANEDRTRLADLLERRLAETSDPEQRIALEVSRGRALAEVGDSSAAKEALAAALDANPDHADALDAFAELCAAEGDWSGAEQAWLRLARHAQEPERQAEIYRKLAELYDTDLPNPARAELSYREVLKRQPNDADAMARLVQVYGRLEQPDKAVELQMELVNKAGNPDDKRTAMIGLALVYEQISGDKRKAESTLEKARKAWPAHPSTLKALADFYSRNSEGAALHVLLDRAANDARRALNTGRFDPAFFETLGTVAELRGNTDGARIAAATLAGLRGEEAQLTGAGVGAGNAQLDDLLSPDLLSGSLRALLKKAGAALDRAYELDLRALRASPMPAESSEIVGQFRQVATAFGIPNLDIYVSGAVGPVCMPVSASPPQIVFGKALLETDDDPVRSFLFVRALKILQAHGAALARTAPIDLWPVTAAFLKVFAPDWQPQGVDMKKMTEAHRRISAAMPSQVAPDVGVLALEVTGSIGNRASQLATAIHELGDRTGLLALGDPNVAIRGVAFAAGHTGGPPASGTDRLKWIVRNPEARDLAIFSVSDAYASARAQLGLEG